LSAESASERILKIGSAIGADMEKIK